MSNQSEIDTLLKRLAQFRGNLRHLVQQAAGFGGEEAAPLEVINGISNQREQIDSLKTRLRALGAIVADEFDDGAGALAPQLAAPAAPPPASPPPAPGTALRPTAPQQLALARLLLACQSIGDRTTREIVLGFLPAAVRNSIARNNADLPDVIAIVQACARYDGAIEQLLQAIYDFEGDSVGVVGVKAYVAAL
jgi:hypothetical protein